MGGRSQVLEDRILVADFVGRDVGDGRQGRLFVFEDQRPDELGVELEDHGAGLGGALGRDGKGIHDEEVWGQDGLG